MSSVKAITPQPIKYIYDSISLKETQEPAYELLAPGGSLILLLALIVDKERLDKWKTVAQVYGSAHDPAQRDLSVSAYKRFKDLLESDDIKVSKQFS